MQLVKIRKSGEVYPLEFSTEINWDAKPKPKLTYFKRGEGYKKTVAFDVLDEMIPDKWDKLSWLEIAKLTDKYGLEVGEYLADGKVAGIIARQTALNYLQLYRKIKDVMPDDFDAELFGAMQGVYLLSCFGTYMLDVPSLDEWFTQNDPEYDGEACTYKGEKCSMSQYVELKYGKKYSEVFNALI